jgi:lipopolysaccharide export system permease protein
LGEARTTRQGRGLAIATAIVGVVLIRVLGFAASSAVVRSPAAVAAIYGVPLGGIAISLMVIFKGARVRAMNARIRSALLALRPSRKTAAQGA